MSASPPLDPDRRPVQADHWTGFFSHYSGLGRHARRRLIVGVSPGFTLLELMIVVGIVGILSAIALPQYRRTMALAEASSMVLETISFAEQCAVAHKSGLSFVVAQPSGDESLNCNGSSIMLINSRRWSGDATGVVCLGRLARPSHRQAMLVVDTRGGMICRFRQ